MSLLSPIVVRVRAVVFLDGGVVVAREPRRGRHHVTLPGGRAKEGESLVETVAREVLEETGLQVKVGDLIYVAEVLAARRQDLNLIFRAEAKSGTQGVDLVGLDADPDGVLPPILKRIRQDAERGWPNGPQWLGNIWRADLNHEL